MKRLVCWGAIFLTASAWAHSGEGLVLLPLFFVVALAAGLTMAGVWLGVGLVLALLLSGLLSWITGRGRALYLLLPALNVWLWLSLYDLIALHLSVPFLFFPGIKDVNLTDPFLPPGLYLTLVVVPVLAFVGWLTAFLWRLLARWRSRSRAE